MSIDRRRALTGLALLLSTQAKAQGQAASVSVQQAFERQKAGVSVLVDIRTPEEWAETGTAVGAHRLDMTAQDFVARLQALRAANPGKEIDIICRTANRTSYVQRVLEKAGWTNIVNVRGGMAGNASDKGWIASGLPVAR